MSTINLHMDNYQFYPGNIVTGKVMCHFRSGKDVGKIMIRLRGEESTNWTNTERYYDNEENTHKQRTVHCHGNRDFLLLDHMVHGGGLIGIGEHAFPFELALPQDLPGSFQHIYGRIRFLVKATVDRQWKMSYHSEKEITIISPVNLQMLSSGLLQPFQYSDEKTVCCLCCAGGLVQLDVNLEKRAFVLGENARIKVYCLNASRSNVENLVVEIKQTMVFKSTHPSIHYKYDSQLVTASNNSGVGAHGDKTLNLGLEIPPSTVVPNFKGCELFSSKVKLKVVAAISGFHTNLDITTNVALGHVPSSQAPLVTAQYGQFPPPYSVNNIQPMQMPMPLTMPRPGYEAETDKVMGSTHYNFPEYCPVPSTPQEFGYPSK